MGLRATDRLHLAHGAIRDEAGPSLRGDFRLTVTCCSVSNEVLPWMWGLGLGRAGE